MKYPNKEAYIKAIITKSIKESIVSSSPVKIVQDPYIETDVAYIVIAINPCKPVIREVSKGTAGAYSTLVDAKEAARNTIQNAIQEGKDSLSEIRQIGIEKIKYITL